MRVTGQSTQDQMLAMNAKLDALAAKLKKVSMVNAGSSNDSLPCGPASQPGYHQAGARSSDDAEVVALVFFPMEAGETMLRAHYEHVVSKFATEEPRATARPRIGQLGTTFGVRFARARGQWNTRLHKLLGGK